MKKMNTSLSLHPLKTLMSGSEDEVLQYKNRAEVLKVADYIVPGHGPMFKVTKP